MSCHQHGYHRPSLANPPYRSSLLASHQGYIPYLHRAAVRRFELVALFLLGSVRVGGWWLCVCASVCVCVCARARMRVWV